MKGNHDLSFEDGYLEKHSNSKTQREYGPEPKKLLKNCIYLEVNNFSVQTQVEILIRSGPRNYYRRH